MKPVFFEEPAEFRAWLKRHHRDAAEVLVGFRKRATGEPSLTWPQAVDQALCFGWIDGVRKRIDDESYTVRFTPRRAGSKWSAVNIARVEVLEADGSLQPAGREALAQRSEAKSRTYSYEQERSAVLDARLQRTLKANKPAWTFFQAQAPSYQRKAVHWVMGAKGEDVRRKRLTRLIDAFADSRRL